MRLTLTFIIRVSVLWMRIDESPRAWSHSAHLDHYGAPRDNEVRHHGGLSVEATSRQLLQTLEIEHAAVPVGW